jgi:hypothetical protein
MELQIIVTEEQSKCQCSAAIGNGDQTTMQGELHEVWLSVDGNRNGLVRQQPRSLSNRARPAGRGHRGGLVDRSQDRIPADSHGRIPGPTDRTAATADWSRGAVAGAGPGSAPPWQRRG